MSAGARYQVFGKLRDWLFLEKNGIRGPFLEVLGVSKKKENPIPTVTSLENEDLGDNKVMRVGPL